MNVENMTCVNSFDNSPRYDYYDDRTPRKLLILK